LVFVQTQIILLFAIGF